MCHFRFVFWHKTTEKQDLPSALTWRSSKLEEREWYQTLGLLCMPNWTQFHFVTLSTIASKITINLIHKRALHRVTTTLTDWQRFSVLHFAKTDLLLFLVGLSRISSVSVSAFSTILVYVCFGDIWQYFATRTAKTTHHTPKTPYNLHTFNLLKGW